MRRLIAEREVVNANCEPIELPLPRVASSSNLVDERGCKSITVTQAAANVNARAPAATNATLSSLSLAESSQSTKSDESITTRRLPSSLSASAPRAASRKRSSRTLAAAAAPVQATLVSSPILPEPISSQGRRRRRSSMAHSEVPAVSPSPGLLGHSPWPLHDHAAGRTPIALPTTPTTSQDVRRSKRIKV